MILEEGLASLLNAPLWQGFATRGLGGRSPPINYFPLPLSLIIKGRGIKGVGSVKNRRKEGV
jgi:hypothetical protein